MSVCVLGGGGYLGGLHCRGGGAVNVLPRGFRYKWLNCVGVCMCVYTCVCAYHYSYYRPEVRRGKYWGLGIFLLQYFPLVSIMKNIAL